LRRRDILAGNQVGRIRNRFIWLRLIVIPGGPQVRP
jgi:hypothetical protein